MKTSQKGIDLIKRFEGLKLEAYKCPAGVWTIGYGHTANVKPGMKITANKAEELLKQDLDQFERAVLSENLNINQNQFDALVSFTYNVGPANFKRSTLLKMIRVNPNSLNIPSEFAKWNKAGGRILPGLSARRKAESNLYFYK